jgi:long-subunit fatty acid transport protein
MNSRKGLLYASMSIALVIVSTSAWNPTFSQSFNDEALGYYEDALRFSRTNPYSTARIMGMGGASQALGADLFNAATNPAGLGLYRKSDLSLTLGQTSTNTSSRFLGQEIDGNRGKFHIGQFGIGFHTGKEDFEPGAFRGGTFAINYSRQNLFDNRVIMQGNNPYRQSGGGNRNVNSIVDFYYDLARQVNPNPSIYFDNQGRLGDYTGSSYSYDEARIGQAYESFILDIFSNNQGEYFSTNFPETYDTRQQIRLQNIGRINQWDLSFGGNVEDKFCFGVGLGIASLNFRQEVNYNETIGRVYDSYPDPAETQYFQRFQGVNINNGKSLEVTGNGLNFKFGFLANLNDDLRWGASLQSPTRYTLNDKFTESLSANFNGLPYWGTPPPNNLSTTGSLDIVYQFNYDLRTPWRYSTGLSYLINKTGLVTAEIDYLAFGKAKVSSANDPLIGDNAVIRNIYQDGFNVRMGGEYKYDVFRFRLGGNYMTNPYANGSDGSILGISGGAGIRLDDYYIDLGINQMRFNTQYQFNPVFTPQGNISNRVTSVMVTGGLIF